MNTNGLILKGIGGFYYVETTNGIIECKAKGIFRNLQQVPTPGDHVEIESTQENKGIITSIGERKNFLARPTIANLDKMFIVISSESPRPNLFIIDNMTAILDYKNIEPVIVITKTDLSDVDWLSKIYLKCGFRVFCVNNITGDGTRLVKQELKGFVSAFTGNSGVGKTSLLNCILPELDQKTGEISEKLGRGKHTTRQVELFAVPGGGYIADTPGFSAVDISTYGAISKDQLQFAFREFEPFLNQCQFTGCSHTTEKGCVVLEAVADGKIPISRHESYCKLYWEANEIKEWEQK